MNFEHDIKSCLTVLRGGGLILYPTDTIWGIGCDATDPEAVKKIYALKERPETKSMIILLADEKDLLQFISQPDPQAPEYLKKVKKPTTVIYDGAVGLAQNLVNTDGTVAIRIVQETFCKHLIKRFQKPIVSTSANLSGEPPPGTFRDISLVIRQGVDYIVQYRQDDTTLHKPSSIVRWNKDGTQTIIRE